MMSPLDNQPKTDDIQEIERTDRAIVYLTVDWSVPERNARKVVQAALASLPDLGFVFYTVDEDGPITGPWLISHGWTRHPTGYGSLLWFERGIRIETELLPGHAGSESIIRKTIALWGPSAQQTTL